MVRRTLPHPAANGFTVDVDRGRCSLRSGATQRPAGVTQHLQADSDQGCYQTLTMTGAYTGEMVARDVRVEPLVGGIVLLVVATYFSLTQITGVALVALIGLTAAFALQILYSQIRITAITDRDRSAFGESVKRAPRALLWSVVLLIAASAVSLMSLWFVISRSHFQALVSLGAGAVFVFVAVLGLRAAAKLKRTPLPTT